ncbi:uncharacterized protein LOC144464222 [Epinephelus lanceolatus]
MLRRPGKGRRYQDDMLTVLRDMLASDQMQMERQLEQRQHWDQHLLMQLEDARDARHQEAELARGQHQEQVFLSTLGQLVQAMSGWRVTQGPQQSDNLGIIGCCRKS